MRSLERVFLFCIFFVITNNYIGSCCSTANATAEQEQDKVGTLPGQDFNVNFAHYAGYITVDEKSGRALFYWFFEATQDPDSKPLALWLNGGPGCSSIAYGEAEEIGPFRPKADGKSIDLNPYSWNQAANIIFLDSPAGVGFSYSNSSSDILDIGDKKSAADNLAFILKWLERFPQYKGRELYIIGESYAGHFVPQLCSSIQRYNSGKSGEEINLKGFLIGNPLIDDYHDQRGIFDFMYTIGMISEKTQKLLKQTCGREPYLNSSTECNNAHSAAADEIGNLDYYSVFTPVCTSSSSTLLSKRWPVGLLNDKYDPCTEQHSIAYFNLPEVQEVLHVRGAPLKWETCSTEVHYAWKDSSRSLLNTIKRLSTTGIRIWVYSGNTDAVIPTTSTLYSLKAMKLPTVDSHKPWYQDEQLGGWIQEYEGLIFVIVRDGGHEVPLHKPKQALTLFKNFLSGTPMTLSSSRQFSDL